MRAIKALMARMRASQSYDGVYEQPMATPMIVAAEKSFILVFKSCSFFNNS